MEMVATALCGPGELKRFHSESVYRAARDRALATAISHPGHNSGQQLFKVP